MQFSQIFGIFPPSPNTTSSEFSLNWQIQEHINWSLLKHIPGEWDLACTRLLTCIFFGWESSPAPVYFGWFPNANMSFIRFARFAANTKQKPSWNNNILMKSLTLLNTHPNTQRCLRMRQISSWGFRSELSWGRPTFVQPLRVSWMSTRTNWWHPDRNSRRKLITTTPVGSKLVNIIWHSQRIGGILYFEISAQISILILNQVWFAVYIKNIQYI